MKINEISELSVKHIKRLALEHGMKAVRRELVYENMSPSLALLLCKGEYTSTPNEDTLRKILKVLNKFGVHISIEKAS